MCLELEPGGLTVGHTTEDHDCPSPIAQHGGVGSCEPLLHPLLTVDWQSCAGPTQATVAAVRSFAVAVSGLEDRIPQSFPLPSSSYILHFYDVV